MNNHYTKEFLLTSAFSDRFCELGLVQATLLTQDAMTELFYSYRCDAIRLSQSHQVIWAVARTKIRYDAPIRWMDRVKITAFPVKVSPVAIHLNLLVEGTDGTPLLRARQEVCAIDVASHALRKTDTTPFPRNLDWPAPIFTDPFCRTKVKLGAEDLVFSHQVRTADTDMNQHMNNTDYVRLILDTQPSAFWNAHRVVDFDVHYVSEAVEGEELQVYCQEAPGQLTVQIKRGETSLVKAFLQLAPRQ